MGAQGIAPGSLCPPANQTFRWTRSRYSAALSPPPGSRPGGEARPLGSTPAQQTGTAAAVRAAAVAYYPGLRQQFDPGDLHGGPSADELRFVRGTVYTPQNLTNRLKGGERTSLIIEGEKEKVGDLFKTNKDIKSYEVKDAKNGTFQVLVESEKDIRKDLAKQVISKKLGLLELSSDKFTLEDIFLHLTTNEEVS